MYRRKPHPRLSEHGYDVVELDTGVHHELMVPSDTPEPELLKLIARYVRGYERAYPHTRSEEFRRWLEGRLGRRLEEVEPEGGAT